jgi:hypothetical protein
VHGPAGIEIKVQLTSNDTITVSLRPQLHDIANFLVTKLKLEWKF